MKDLSAAEEHGARVSLPPRVRPDARMPGAMVDPETHVRWWVHVDREPRLCLDDHALDDLREHAEHHARAMFLTSPEARERHGSRIDDPTWSPLVDFERRGDVLHLVHRMGYEPGREMVMGHRMLPTARGLIEVRVLAIDHVTGGRESVLTLAAMTNGNDRPLTQQEMDSPAHDATFPAHALSRVRAALDGVALEALAPAAPLPPEEVEMTTVGVALVPPPRFAYLGDFDGGEWFGRTSFCLTDGVEHFGVARCRGRVPRDALARRGRDHACEMLERAGATDVSAEVLADDEHGAFVFARAAGSAGPLGQAYGFFAEDDGRWGYVAILGSTAVPPARRVQDLRASLRTRRTLETKKPFWKLW